MNEQRLADLSRGAADDKRLPSLMPDKSAWEEWVRGVLKRVSEWINSWFGPTDLKLEGLMPLLQALLILFVALLVGYLVWLILRRPREDQEWNAVQERAGEGGARLHQELEAALAAKQFALAARIRWKIWLREMQWNSSETPADRQLAQRQIFDQAMFETELGSQTLFEKLKKPGGFIADRALYLLVGAGLVLYFVLLGAESYVAKHEVATTQSRGPMNVGTLVKGASDKKLLRAAVLYPEQLRPGSSVILLLSPKIAPSEREAELFLQAVNAGSDLFVTFHDEASFAAVNHLLIKLHLNALEFREDDRFKNQQSEEVTLDTNLWPWNAGEKYHFYSRLVFEGLGCMANRFFCFVRPFDTGKGRVIIVAGVPPFSAAMLERGDNVKMAARLLDESKTLIIDEYHQLVSDRTLWDLAGQSFFWIPMLGLLAGLLAYYLFGDDLKPAPAARAWTAESYHSFARRFLRAGLGGQTDIFPVHRALLERMMRRDRDALNDLRKAASVRGLLEIHHRWAQRRNRAARGHDADQKRI